VAIAPAKINLYLHVVGRRPNGYHELDSLVAFADAHDLIQIEPSERVSLTLAGPFGHMLDNDSDNLVLRAAKTLSDHAGLNRGASITLVKNLPVASGIGGGSADAAATLRALNSFWEVGLDDQALASLGGSLGADVPVCLFGRTARMQGIGEIIEPGPDLPEIGLLLVNPGIGVSTLEVFSKREGTFSGPAPLPASFRSAADLAEFLSRCQNDLLAPARLITPQIDLVLGDIARQRDCLFSSLSGSGATCFGVFTDPKSAHDAVDDLKQSRAGWWSNAGKILPQTPAPAEQN
jgi:4-diphosphocytidyl-2-C-methyl-D-erythritol kinase